MWLIAGALGLFLLLARHDGVLRWPGPVIIFQNAVQAVGWLH